MIMTEITITSNLAHFKNSTNGKNQNTFKCPPVSTIVGILKNIYNESISDFLFGYTCQYNGLFTDLSTIYKEINPNARLLTDSARFTADVCAVEYLVDPIIKIYTTIQDAIEIKEILNLGKTNCLAKCSFKQVEIVENKSIGYNQWTDVKTGNGIIKRINKETIYNKSKGYFDYYTMLARMNNEFTSSYEIEELNEGIYLWEYKGIGDVKCYQESI